MKKGLIIAVVLGAIGAGLFVWYLQHVKETTSGGVPIEVLVASKNIELGARIKRSMLTTRSLPETYLEERHVRYRNLDEVIGVRVINKLHAGESILWSDLANQTYRQGDLSALIGVGMRALTIHVRSRLGGLVRAGDRVDLVLTTLPRGRPEDTIPLLQNVTVLAVGRRVGTYADAPDIGDLRKDLRNIDRRQNEQRFQAYGEPVTIALSVEQAGILAHAQSMGTLMLALRNPNDTTIEKGLPRIETEDLLDAEERAKWQARERAGPLVKEEKTDDEEDEEG